MPFRKKPVVVRAIQWRGDNWSEIAAFHRGDHFNVTTMDDGVYLNIATLEGVMQARTTLGNLQILCEQCNVGKGDLDAK